MRDNDVYTVPAAWWGVVYPYKRPVGGAEVNPAWHDTFYDSYPRAGDERTDDERKKDNLEFWRKYFAEKEAKQDDEPKELTNIIYNPFTEIVV